LVAVAHARVTHPALFCAPVYVTPRTVCPVTVPFRYVVLRGSRDSVTGYVGFVRFGYAYAHDLYALLRLRRLTFARLFSYARSRTRQFGSRTVAVYALKHFAVLPAYGCLRTVYRRSTR